MQIPGAAGELEAMFTEPSESTSLSTVLCHPHPQYGGSMHDAVLASCEAALLAHGSACLRFNFRGVGASAGRYDNGEGELEDVQSAVAWLRTTHPDHTLWVLGYSFGASMVYNSLVNDLLFPTPQRAILIAPPVGMMSFDGNLPDGCQLSVVAGTADEFIDQQKLTAWPAADVHLLDGVDHFFGGAHQALTETVRKILQ